MLAGMGGGAARRDLNRTVGSGSSDYTSSGSFPVPTNYTSMTVYCHGRNGAQGPAGNDSGNCSGEAGKLGGTGGLATKTWAVGDAGAPAPGGTIGVTIDSTGSQFGSSTVVRGNSGTDGGRGSDAYEVTNGEGNPVGCGLVGNGGSPGTNGTASGGDSNTTGGSSYSAGRVLISYNTLTTS